MRDPFDMGESRIKRMQVVDATDAIVLSADVRRKISEINSKRAFMI